MSGRIAYEIFKNEEDWADWDKYVQITDALPGLTDEQKERGRKAFEYLRKPEVLGENFLARNNKHPLYDHFAGIAAWTRKIKQLTRFAKAWEALREADGFSKAVKNEIVSGKHKFTERMSVLELAFKFLNVGFSPSFDQKVTVFKPRGMTRRLLPFQTTPDLALLNEETDEKIFVEVSALSFGELKERAGRTYHRIFDLLTNGALWRGDLFPRARINRILSDEELKELVAKVQATIDDARSSNEFRVMEIEGTIEMCIAPRHEAERADLWASERGIEEIPVEGPSYSPYDPIRLKNAIRHEQEQLPADKPGMVIITADWSLLFFAHGYGEIVSSLDEALSKYPKLLGIIVSHTYQGGEEREFAVTDGRHTFVRRDTDEVTEETVIAINQSCNFNVSTSTLERIQAAFVVG